MKHGRIWAGVRPTVPLGINLHIGKKLGRDGSHCTTRQEIVKQGRTRAGVGPTVPPWMTCMQGRSLAGVGPTVPLGRN